MIDESLLFRLGFIFPDITMMDVVISLFFVLLLAYLLLRNTSHPKPKLPSVTPLPSVGDIHFVPKLREHIRLTLAHRYSPEHTHAHTVREVELYAKGDPLLDILRELEHIEYTSKSLAETERTDFIRRVKRGGK